MIAPIYDSIELVRFCVVPALKLRSGSAGVYWLEKTDGATYPFVVVQSQDLGGQGVPRLNSLGWTGLITVKALAQANGTGNAQASAETLMKAVAPGMDTLIAPVGYDLSVVYQRPVVIPPLDGVWQAAHIWRVNLERE